MQYNNKFIIYSIKTYYISKGITIKNSVLYAYFNASVIERSYYLI